MKKIYSRKENKQQLPFLLFKTTILFGVDSEEHL
jgi:hypothetical protein